MFGDLRFPELEIFTYYCQFC